MQGCQEPVIRSNNFVFMTFSTGSKLQNSYFFNSIIPNASLYRCSEKTLFLRSQKITRKMFSMVSTASKYAVIKTI